MKNLLLILFASAALAVIGCSKAGGGLDTAKVEAAFSAVQQADKAELQNALTALKSGNYSGALASLQKAAASLNLTAEQKSALADLIAQVQAKAGDLVKQAGGVAAQAATNLQVQVDAAVKQVGDEAAKAAANVQAAGNDAVKKAGDETNKGTADLQKTLPKP